MTAGSEDRRGLQAQEGEPPLEAGKGKKADSLLECPRGAQRADTQFSPVRPILGPLTSRTARQRVHITVDRCVVGICHVSHTK